MRPVTDRHKVSRAKLSYIIDATAAPVCIIAPISSWAAAVTSSVPEDSGINGFAVFLQTIPYNLYAILTLVMVLLVTVLRVDFGPMKKHEMNAIAGDLFTTPGRPYEGNEEEVINAKAHLRFSSQAVLWQWFIPVDFLSVLPLSMRLQLRMHRWDWCLAVRSRWYLHLSII